jgi:hypothetical protein
VTAVRHARGNSLRVCGGPGAVASRATPVSRRFTEDDPAGGDMTLIDVPFTTGMSVVSGKAYYKSACLDLPPGIISTCSSVELVDLAILDADSDRFAVQGVSCCAP